jgi:polar amino acid transport system ATP-binding protein
MMEKACMLQVKDLHKAYHHHEVLKGIHLDVDRGQVLTILGRSGSGKSTLLRCVHLLEDFERGEIFLDGERLGYQLEDGKQKRLHASGVARQRSRIGMVFQHFALFPHMSVLENITVGPIQVQKRSRKEARSEAESILDDVGMIEKRDAYPPSLSGGQKQRVGIARALAMRPKVMLFDEPTSALDPELVHGILALMIRIAEGGMTMLVVTHEIEFAKSVSSEITFMHDGQIIERGPAGRMLSAPDHPETRQFLRSILQEGSSNEPAEGEGP